MKRFLIISLVLILTMTSTVPASWYFSSQKTNTVSAQTNEQINNALNEALNQEQENQEGQTSEVALEPLNYDSITSYEDESELEHSDDPEYEKYREKMEEELNNISQSKDNSKDIATNLAASSWGGSSKLSNPYLDIATYSGRFSLGTTGGLPSTASDDYKKLIYGHPNPRTSYTTVQVDGNNYIYASSNDYVSGNKVISSMVIQGVTITQTLGFAMDGSVMSIKYGVKNDNSSSKKVGIRIMMDTMLGNNDGASFRLPGVGNVTSEVEYNGSSIPSKWYVYDSLTNPNVSAVGTLKTTGKKAPDKVQFAYWGSITGTEWTYNTSSSKSVSNDSAVAIYYNPESIGGGGSTSYETYYGLKGTDGSVAESPLKNRSFRILANSKGMSSETDSYSICKNAVLTIDDKSYSANSSGIIKGVDLSSRKNATITASGYKTQNISIDSLLNESSIYLEKANASGVPIIGTVLVDNKNARASTVKISKDSPNSVNVKVDWNGNSYKKIYLCQGSKSVSLNQNTYNSVNIASKFSSSSPIYIVATNNSNQTSKKKLNLSFVSTASNSGIPKNLNFGLNTKADLSAIDFLNTAEMNMTIGDVAATVTIEGNKAIISMGINDSSVNEKINGDIKNVLTSIDKGASYSKSYKNLKKHLKKKKTDFIMPDVSLTIFGYAEASYDISKKKWTVIEGKVGFILEDVKLGTSIPIAATGGILKLKMEIEMALEAAGKVALKSDNTYEMSLYGDFNITPYLGIGAGFGDVIGGEGGGKYNLNWKVKKIIGGGWGNKLSGTFKYYFDLYAFGKSLWGFPMEGKIGKTKVFWEKGISIKNAGGIITPEEAASIYDISNYSLVESQYAEDPTYILNEEVKDDQSNLKPDFVFPRGTNIQTLNQEGDASENILVQNEYFDSKPTLHELAGGKTLLVWGSQSKDLGIETINSQIIRYMVHDGTSWGEPKSIPSDGKSDYAPVINTINNKVVIAWEKQNEILASDTSSEESVSKLDICVSIFDEENEEFTETTVLEDNEGCIDMKPHIYKANTGDAGILWVKNTANDPFGINGNNILMQSVLEEGQWSAPVKVKENLNPINSIAASRNTIYFTADSTGERTSLDDSELYMLRYGELSNITNNQVSETSCKLTDIGFVYISDDNLMQIDSTGETVTIMSDSAISLGDFQIKKTKEGTDIYYIDGTYEESDIYVISQKNGETQWSKPTPVVDTMNGITNSLSIAGANDSVQIATNAKELLSFNEDESPVFGPSNIYYQKSAPKGQLELESIDFDIEEVIAGEYVHVEYSLKNVGSVPITNNTNVKFSVGTEEISTRELGLNLETNEVKEDSLYIMVPDDGFSEDIKIEAESVDGSGTSILKLTDNFSLAKENLRINAAEFYEENDKTIFYVDVENTGIRETTNPIVEIYKSGESGEFIASGQAIDLEPATAQTLTLEKNGIISNEENAEYYITLNDPVHEYDYTDNSALIEIASTSTTISKHEKPNYSIDFVNECIAEEIPELVEYKYSNDTTWNAGEGESLRLIPGTTKKTIQFRVKSTEGMQSSDIQSLDIPARQNLSGVKALKNGNSIKIINLNKGKEYEYVINNSDQPLDDWLSADSFTADSDTAYVPFTNNSYLHIRQMPSSGNFITDEKISKISIPSDAVLNADFDDELLPENWSVEGGTSADWYISDSMGINSSPCIYFNSGSAAAEDKASLVSPSFRIEDGRDGALSFYVYHTSNYSYIDDRIQLQYRTSGGDWTNIGNEIKRYSSQTGWKLYQATIPAGTDLQLRFVGTSENGANLYLDEIMLISTAKDTPGNDPVPIPEDKPVITAETAATSIVLNMKAKTLEKKGKKVTLKASVKPDNATKKTVTWSSSNPKVAIVNASGVVTAVKKGSCIVTAKTSNGKIAKCAITVGGKAVKKIKLKKSRLSLKKGKGAALKVSFSPQKPKNKKLYWTTSNSKVVKVNSKGKIKAVKKGKATITVYSYDGNKKAKCVVTVK